MKTGNEEAKAAPPSSSAGETVGRPETSEDDGKTTITFKLLNGSERKAELTASQLQTLKVRAIKLSTFQTEIQDEGKIIKFIF